MIERVLETEVMDSVEESLAYESMDHSTVNAAFVERLTQLGASGRMLDLGTGPAQIPVLVCRRIADATVLATDLASSMIELAEQRVRSEGLVDRIELRRVDAKQLPFPSASFDVVFSNTVLHHVPDPRPFLREAWRVLRPSGVFLVRDLRRPASEEALEALVRLHTRTDTPSQRALFRASLNASFTRSELSSLVAELGIDASIVESTDRHISIERASSAL
ncbi:MAG: methyltransferase domain-containing protein [Deltaproteobacteria bacterium]|nr:methyltransferase domain-containing protein [Deltaproteobacteria bacterium]